MGKPKPTAAKSKHEPERLRQFVEIYMANGGNGAAAYRDTHPNCRSRDAAYACASRLLRSAKVQEILATRRRSDRRIWTREQRQQFWTDIADGRYPEASVALRVQAASILGRSQGDFVEQVEVRADVQYHISWDEDEDEDEEPSPEPARANVKKRQPK